MTVRSLYQLIPRLKPLYENGCPVQLANMFCSIAVFLLLSKKQKAESPLLGSLKAIHLFDKCYL